MNKAESKADFMTQEQIRVEGRVELKAKAGELCFLHFFFIFHLPILLCMKARFSFGTQ